MRAKHAIICLLSFTAVVVAGHLDVARAASLKTKLSRLVTLDGLAPIDIASPIVQRIVARGIDFPATATTPGLTYTYNEELSMYERSSPSLGPVFLERADTVGRHKLNVGFSYLFADLTDYDGDNFGDFIFNDVVNAKDENFVFEGTDFSLETHVFSFSATYGITSRWDVNLVLPVLYSDLAAEGDVLIDTPAQTARGSLTLDALVGGTDTAGFGDLMLRTKYQFVDASPIKLAAGLALRLPSGDEDEFQGLGDVTVTPSLIASHVFKRHDFHANVGFEFNADDMERARVRYGIGATLQPIERLAMLVDVVGSSSLEDDYFIVKAPRFKVDPLADPEFTKGTNEKGIRAFVPRNDIVDLAVGFKANIVGNAVGFVSAIIPLTDDGLRVADAIPTGGIEVTF